MATSYQTLSDLMTPNQFMGLLITQPMLQLFALLVTGLSSFFLIRSIIMISPAEIAKILGACLDYNYDLGKNFVLQKTDTVVGFILLIMSLLSQMWSISQPLRWIDTEGLTMIRMVVTLIVFLFVAVMSESARRALIHKYTRELSQRLKMNLKQ
jgi:hypothetical protein